MGQVFSPGLDCVIVGGGVAGATTALVLAQSGIRVTLIEKTAVFEDRVRGEGIHPWGMTEVAALGLRDPVARAGGLPMPDWCSYQDRELVNTTHWPELSEHGEAETSVYHPMLQTRLLEAAVAQGVRLIRQAALVSVERLENGFRLTIDQNGEALDLTTPVLIAADGSGSRTRSLLGIKREREPVTHWIAGVRVQHHDLADRATHAASNPGSLCFAFTQADRYARLYAVLTEENHDRIRSDPSGRSMIAFLASEMPEGSLDRAVVAGPQGVFANADIWADTHENPGLLLIGDAVSANDPSQGHGLSLAFRDVRELQAIVARDGLRSDALAAAEFRFRGYRQTMRAVATWQARLWFTIGQEADQRRERYQAARENDPEAGGFARMILQGPRDLVADEAARRRFFGEALD